TAHDDSDGHEHGGGPATAPAAEGVGGLAVSAQGHRLVVERTALTAGRPESLKLRVHGPDGMPVTAFDVVHDKPMHLIVVRRDMTGYQHLHPEMSADGTWSVPVTLPQPGAWRAYADFTVRGPGDRRTALTLGLDLTAAGDYRPRALPAPATSATVAGYTVEYEGTARVGAAQPLLFRVKKSGAAAAVEPYLGAYGHLVVLREGDLGYVHVHPEERLAGAAVKFWLAAPGPGRYRMFFDFRVAGVVHTAEFSLAVP
ncbi:MAG TPA: hypothetical protein VES42_08245, partial [Pilimelia sp.]|nr:hypothetical protein [Pilimelia sp.]